ncbi:Clp protease N-terminal domain-containing protein [Thermocatellispora tengchongensis]|uniref:Clp protease N-terminal domain-containing protein n=1 Tax=Thermocatellispora tengchongensis TaxID=1073253 RepID=UPI003629EF26
MRGGVHLLEFGNVRSPPAVTARGRGTGQVQHPPSEARGQGHDRVTGEHLLTTLARLNEGVAVMTLNSLGVDLEDRRTRPIGTDLGRITELTRHEAAGLGHRYVGTEHLLLALLHEEVSEALGVGLRQTRDRVIKILHGGAL